MGNRVYSDMGKNGKSRVHMKHVSNETCERIKIEKKGKSETEADTSEL